MKKNDEIMNNKVFATITFQIENSMSFLFSVTERDILSTPCSVDFEKRRANVVFENDVFKVERIQLDIPRMTFNWKKKKMKKRIS